MPLRWLAEPGERMHLTKRRSSVIGPGKPMTIASNLVVWTSSNVLSSQGLWWSSMSLSRTASDAFSKACLPRRVMTTCRFIASDTHYQYNLRIEVLQHEIDGIDLFFG